MPGKGVGEFASGKNVGEFVQMEEKGAGNSYRWREMVPGIRIGGGKGAGDGKRYREFVRPAGKGLVTGDYR